MDFYNNFISACNIRNEYPTNVCKACGLSASSYKKWDKSVPTSNTIIKLATYLNCSTDKLLLGKDPENTPEHQKLISLYDKLSSENKEMSFGLLEAMYDVQTAQERKQNIKIITIPHSTYKVSAGTGYDLDGEDWEDIRVVQTPESEKADFTVTVDGDSMLPYYEDGDIVLVKSQEEIDEGQVGIFVADNEEGFIKKRGADCLISLNPEFDDIQFSDHESIKCCGLVLGIADVIG